MLTNPNQEPAEPKGFVSSPSAEACEGTAPSDISARGWREILRQTALQVFEQRLLGEAAAVAFYALLTVFPAMATLVWLCGTLVEPEVATQKLQDWASGTLPSGAAEVAGELLGRLAALREGGVGIGAGTVLIATLLWGATATAAQLFGALNVAYGEREGRSLLRLHSVALLYAVSAAVFILVALGVILVPAALAHQASTGYTLDQLLHLGRWPVLLAAVAFGLALTYRHGPSRKCPQWQWVSWGGAFAALVWLLSSAAFSFYVSRSGGYDRLYGSLGAVVALMVWAWLSSAAILIGAALNAGLEVQSTNDRSGRSS